MTEKEQVELYKHLGFRIKELREKALIKQGAFAQLLQLSRASIVNIEKGRQRPPLHLLWDIASILNVEVTEILSPLENRGRPIRDKISSEWKKTIQQSTKGNPESRKKITDFLKEITSKDNGNVS